MVNKRLCSTTSTCRYTAGVVYIDFLIYLAIEYFGELGGGWAIVWERT